MNDLSGHDNSTCARVWQVLRMAHDCVERRLATEFAEIDLTITDFDVLLYLHSHSSDVVRIGSIQESVALSQPALSRLIARLVDSGLVLRSGSEADGQAIQVILSDAGRAFTSHAIDVHNAIIHDVLTTRFTPQEQEVLLQGLSRITR